MPRSGSVESDLIQQLSILQVFHGLLQNRQGLVEVDRQADSGQVLANALLQNGPQADALLVLLGLGQAVPSWRRRLHVPAAQIHTFKQSYKLLRCESSACCSGCDKTSLLGGKGSTFFVGNVTRNIKVAAC